MKTNYVNEIKRYIYIININNDFKVEFIKWDNEFIL